MTANQGKTSSSATDERHESDWWNAPGYWVEFNRYAKVRPWNVCAAFGLVSGHHSEAEANEACKKLKLHAEREEMTVVDVFRSQDGRVFVNVNRDGVQLAHLVAGESFVIPDARSEMATTKPFGYFDKDEKKLYPTKAAADLMGCLESDLLPLYAAPQVPGSSPREAKVSSVTQGQETRAAPPAVAAPLSAIATTTVEHIPEYFDKPGVLDGLSQAHPVLLIRQMANEIARLRALPSATGMREGLEELSLMAAYSNADPTIEELERILDAIGNRVEVLLNGLDSSGAKDG